MSRPLYSHHKATLASFAVFVGACFVLYFINFLWPGIFLALGASLLIRQIMRGRRYDALITTLIFAGLFALYAWAPMWKVILPTLLSVGAIYVLYREFFLPKPRFGRDAREDVERELEDEQRR